MDLLMLLEEIITYGVTFVFVILVVALYVRKGKKESEAVRNKVKKAKEAGRFEPVSLHPYIDLNVCIGSGACVRACPEKDIIGLIDGKATVINATSCIGHGACFHACPVEAISLRIGTEKRGVDLPHVKPDYETNVSGIYIAGELGGMGLIKNSAEQGIQAVRTAYENKALDHGADYDLAIVGAGPAGIAAALEAKRLGMSAVILEQDSLGGTVFTFPRQKIVMTRPMNLPLYGPVKLVNTSKQELLDIWIDAIDKHGIEVRERNKVDAIRPLSDGFKLDVAEQEAITANQVLIAIGRRGTPRKLGVPGEVSTKVAYRLLDPELIEGKKILVVGGGDSAVESALLLNDHNEVTISYRKDQFGRIKPGNQEALERALKEGKLQVAYSSSVIEILPDTVSLKMSDGEVRSLENDLVYIFIGGELPIDFLKNAGIEIEKKFGKIVKKYRN